MQVSAFLTDFKADGNRALDHFTATFVRNALVGCATDRLWSTATDAGNWSRRELRVEVC